MNQVIDHDDMRVSALEAFANAPSTPQLPVSHGSGFSAPSERVHGAQHVAVRRDEANVLQKIKVLAAAAGEYFYYRYPVNNKGKKEYIEGPTIKCANAVARLFGNCDTDVRALDTGSHWVFYARFMDLETGYSLTRPYQQRKNQSTMRGDAGRAEDIAFQIGSSKAIRNVTTNALDTFTTFAWQEAKASIIQTVGRDLGKYKTRVAQRLEELEIDIHRVEAVRGRPIKDWIAADVAKTIAEIQAINDGMATIDETFPPKDASKSEGDTDQALGEFARSASENATSSDDAAAGDTGAAGAEDAATEQQNQASQPAGSGPQATAGSKEGAETGNGYASSNSSAPSTADGPKPPANDAEYKAYAIAWLAEQTDPEEPRARWAREKKLRNDANVTPETRDELEALVKSKVNELKKK